MIDFAQVERCWKFTSLAKKTMPCFGQPLFFAVAWWWPWSWLTLTACEIDRLPFSSSPEVAEAQAACSSASLRAIVPACLIFVNLQAPQHWIVAAALSLSLTRLVADLDCLQVKVCEAILALECERSARRCASVHSCFLKGLQRVRAVQGLSSLCEKLLDGWQGEETARGHFENADAIEKIRIRWQH